MNSEKIIRNILDELKIKKPVIHQNTNEHIVDSIYNTVNKYVLSNLGNFDLTHRSVEGESKKVFKDKESDLCLIRLKPTLYSFTNNRYGTVKGTDILRNKLWKVFSDRVNKESFDVLFYGIGECSIYVNELIKKLISLGVLTKDYPFLTSFLSQVEIDGEVYNVCKYIENQTPLEVVWKRYFTGTMKHNLLDVDKFKTKYGKFIDIEGAMPEIVRFDWRNPFERDGQRHKDECIPDDFAKFWIDIEPAKALCLTVSNIISELVAKKGYTFVDTCYFVNTTGGIVYSEITPDGMRLKKNENSFDKDLWRMGKEEDVICRIWSELYEDLKDL